MRRSTLALPVLLVALAGCGGATTDMENPTLAVQSSGGSLPSSDIDQVLEAEESILTLCGAVRDQEGSDLPVEEATAILVDVLGTSGPEATTASSQNNVTRNLETVVGESAERLRACGRPREAAALDEALERSG